MMKEEVGGRFRNRQEAHNILRWEEVTLTQTTTQPPSQLQESKRFGKRIALKLRSKTGDDKGREGKGKKKGRGGWGEKGKSRSKQWDVNQ